MSHTFTLQTHAMPLFFELMDRGLKNFITPQDEAKPGDFVGFDFSITAWARKAPLTVFCPRSFITKEEDGTFTLTYFTNLPEEQKNLASRIAMEVELLPIDACDDLTQALGTFDVADDPCVDVNLLFMPGVAFVRRDLWETRLDDLDPSEVGRIEDILDSQFLALRRHHGSHHETLVHQPGDARLFRILTGFEPVPQDYDDPASPRIHLAMRY